MEEVTLNNIISFGWSDPGRVREENQDAFHIDEKTGLYIVADGLGGLQGGAHAARYVVSALTKIIVGSLSAAAERRPKNIPETLRNALYEVNAALSQATGGLSGSTVVLAFLEGNKAHLLNAGDSPAYLYRNKSLQCMTKEYNVAGILVEQGKITVEEARQHPLRHQLTSYVGLKKGMIIYENSLLLEKEDRLLLCSDGLHGMVGEVEISRILGLGLDVESTVKALISAANEAGGTDNITALLVEVNQPNNLAPAPE
jgi:PPM family protein phosphatase